MSFKMNEMDSDEKALRIKDRIILNVGGVRHETFKSTLRNFPDTRLAWITGRDDFPDYDPEKNEYFFDRHPGVFQQIMNFYRTGKLHCPSDVCGPLFEEELTFWGIDEKQMESCCWSTYTLHREAQENLKVFNGPDFFEEENSVKDTDEWENREPSDQHRTSSTPGWQRLRAKIWSILDEHTTSKAAKIYVWVSLSFVVVSVLSLCLNTDKNIKNNYIGSKTIMVIDYLCGIWFTAEFILRCSTCPDILEFVKQFLNWIDFLAIIPFYLNFAYDETIVIDILLLVRMLRLFRFFKMSLGLQILKHTVVASSKELVLLLLLILIPVFIFAGILHLCEKGVTSTKFKSIPEACWWAFITLTTVGYGDMAPLTTQGKIFGSICAACSMLISALPISIIGSNFSLYYRHAQAKLKLPKKPRKVLIGAANALVRVERETEETEHEVDEPGHSERNSSDDLTTEVYLGPRRPRRERMSLFTNGIVPQRSSRIRSLSGDHLHNNNNDNITDEKNTCNEHKNTSDHYKSSLLSTSTKSTNLDSPPPRSISFPTNLQGIDKDGVFEHGMDNPMFCQVVDDHPLQCNGNVCRPFSTGTGQALKRNGTNKVFNAPRVTITDESVEQNCDPFRKVVNEDTRPSSPHRTGNSELAPVG